MGRIGTLQTTFTARGLPRYHLEVWHDELKRYSMLRGDNPSALVSQAQSRVAQWDATWRLRAAIANSKRDHEQKRVVALTQTKEAAAVLAGLENVLSNALQRNPAFDWEALRDRRPFPEAKPVEPKAPPDPISPSFPPEPLRDDPPPRTIFDRIFPSRWEAHCRRTEGLFLDAYEKWQKKVGHLRSHYAMKCVTVRRTTSWPGWWRPRQWRQEVTDGARRR
jgi:hypothetical protein